MKSRTTKHYRKRLAELPKHVQKAAKSNYRKWRENPKHPSLNFKKHEGLSAKAKEDIYSVRIGEHWRAVGVYIKRDDAIAWFWVGSHEDYNRL